MIISYPEEVERRAALRTTHFATSLTQQYSTANVTYKFFMALRTEEPLYKTSLREQEQYKDMVICSNLSYFSAEKKSNMGAKRFAALEWAVSQSHKVDWVATIDSDSFLDIDKALKRMVKNGLCLHGEQRKVLWSRMIETNDATARYFRTEMGGKLFKYPAGMGYFIR